MAATPVEVRASAVAYLSRREHSQRELIHKLIARGYPEDLALEVVAELTGERLQSDERFAESFVYSRLLRGQGPLRIGAELRLRGVEEGLIQEALAGADCDWGALAAEAREKRFGTAAPDSPRERARQIRFLQQRGFDHDQIRAALGARPRVSKNYWAN